MVDINEVAENIYMIDNQLLSIPGFGSVYLINEEKKALIDAGPATSANVVLDGIRKIGVRPEDISQALDNTQANTYNALVDISEMMGSEVLVYFDFAGSKMISRFSTTTDAKSGSNILFSINANKVHLFDYETDNIIVN